MVMILTSCNMFRKTSEDIRYTAYRDSSGTIDAKVDLKRTYDIRSSEELYAMKAQGFRSLTVDKDGNIKAEGENGTLLVSAGNKKGSQSGSVDSSGRKKQEVQVEEGTDIAKNKVTDTGAKTQGFSLLWIGLAVGVVATLVVTHYLKKYNVKSRLQKLW